MVDTNKNILFFPDHEKSERDRLLIAVREEHDRALRRFLRMRQLNVHLQEDVLQEVYLKLAKLHDLSERLTKSPDTLRSYLFVIASNIIRDWIRQETVREYKNHVELDENIFLKDSPNPETELVNKQNMLTIRSILQRQKERHRKAFELSRVECRSYREIANELSVSISTVEKYISKVLLAIRLELKL